jgi:hypothetical protein
MNSSRVYAGLTGCALAVAGLSGCLITTDAGPEPAPAPRTGTLTVAWTVGDSRSPAACAQFGADDFELVVRDRAGRPVTTAIADCTDFTITVPLPPGDYEADATLIDARSRAITTTLPLHDIDIQPGPDLTIEIDFPSSSKL